MDVIVLEQELRLLVPGAFGVISKLCIKSLYVMACFYKVLREFGFSSAACTGVGRVAVTDE